MNVSQRVRERNLDEMSKIVLPLKRIMLTKVGRKNGVTARHLANALGVDDVRVVRLAIRELVRYHDMPVVSGELRNGCYGFYLPESDRQFNEYIDFLSDRVEGMQRRLEEVKVSYRNWMRKNSHSGKN